MNTAVLQHNTTITAGRCRTLQDTLPDCLQPPRKTRLQSPAITGPQACAALRVKSGPSEVFHLESSLNICFVEIERHLSAGGLLTIWTVLTSPPVWRARLDHNVRDQGARKTCSNLKPSYQAGSAINSFNISIYDQMTWMLAYVLCFRPFLLSTAGHCHSLVKTMRNEIVFVTSLIRACTQIQEIQSM